MHHDDPQPGQAQSTRTAALLAVGSAASKTSHAAAGVAIIGGLTATDLAAFGGLAVALVGTLVGQGINLYFRRREDRRAERESAARLRASGFGHLVDDDEGGPGGPQRGRP